jgi:TAT (twin-arginine translocation) pathway signal sequence
MRDQALSRRGFLQGSAAVAAGTLLAGALPRRAAAGTAVTGATVNPHAYSLSSWPKAANLFDSYVGLPLAVTVQKNYLTEGSYPNPLPVQIASLAKLGCQFIVCVYPSRTADDSASLAAFLQQLNASGISYRAALVNEWNSGTKFAAPADWLAYWGKYAPVIKAAGVPACALVCATSNKSNFAKIQPGFPASPLPDQYWIDYYGEAYRYNVRIDGLLDQAASYGVPAGIGEFGYAVSGGTTMTMALWQAYCGYLAGLAPRLALGCVYWGSAGHDIVTGTADPKVAGIQQVMQAFQAG